MKVVFILSAGHSGSTLLDILLNAQPHVFGGGEVHTLQQSGISHCACGAPAAACPVWSEVLSNVTFPEQGLEVYRPKYSFIRNTRDYRYVKEPHTTVDTARFEQVNEEIFQRLYAVTESAIIVDSSKSPDRVHALAQSDSIQPYVIHLVRDGRAVTWSYLKKYGRGRHYVTWLLQNVKIELLKGQVELPWLTVRYDSLVEEPEGTLNQILNFIGAPGDVDLGRVMHFQRHQIGGNRMRFSFDSIQADNSWRTNMPLLDRLVATTAQFPLSTYYYFFWHRSDKNSDTRKTNHD
jgi:hypothetical protein